MAGNSQVEDFYSLLGVPDFAELECVRDAYRRLALQLHPDKNSSATATEDFQKLGIAWETLRDPVKRAEYDRSFARTRRKRNRGSEEDSYTTNQSYPESQTRKHSRKEETPFQQRIRIFKTLARKDYLLRLNDWTQFRKDHDSLIIESQSSLQKLEQALEEQTKEDDSEVLQKFSEAIERLPGQRRTGTLPKLIEARTKYMERLAQQISETRTCLAKLFLELEERIHSYEEKEREIREAQIRKALALAGPRDLYGAKERAINAWTALSRVKCALKFSGSLVCVEPWHKAGDWERAVRECDCDRCGQSAYHIVPECGAAKCPGCGVVVCDFCYRDLRLLREHEAWLTGADDFLGSAKSVFSLDFESSESIDPWRGPRHDYGIIKIHEDAG